MEWYTLAMIVAPISGIVGAMVTAFFNYRTQSKSTDGNVDHTDARTLWDKMGWLVQQLVLENDRLRKELEEERRDHGNHN